MIKDRLENFKIYESIHPLMSKAFDYLLNTDLNALDDGRYDIDGDNIYVNIQGYKTKTVAKFEAHRKYIDIQYVISGRENIGITDYGNCTVHTKYNEEKDIEFLTTDLPFNFVTLTQGEFMVMYPQDAHMPSMAFEEPSDVKKAVVKILL